MLAQRNRRNPTEMTAVDFHDAIAERWGMKYRRQSFSRRADELLNFVRHYAGDCRKWLDAGCGAGVLTAGLAKQGYEVTGIDASPKMIATARVSMANHESAAGVTFHVVPDLVDLPWEDETFDGILCSSVVEYLDCPQSAISEFARLLRPGGTLIISAPNRWGLERNLQKLCLAATRIARATPWPAYLAHSVNDYTRHAFLHRLKEAGFAPQAVKPYGALLPRVVTRILGGSLFLVAASKTTLLQEHKNRKPAAAA